MRTFPSALFAALVAVAVPSIALADYSYTFNIPAAVNNVPAGANVQAECSLYPGPNGSGQQLQTGTSTTVPSANGAYSGTFTVKVSSTAKPASYACWLMVWGAGNSLVNIQNGTPTNPVPGWTGTMYTAANIP